MVAKRATARKRAAVATSWGHVPAWRHDPDSYERAVILPNLLRALGPTRGRIVLDLACGDGWLAAELARSGARLIGADASAACIALARKAAPKNATFAVARAERLTFLSSQSVDCVVWALAIQNIADVAGALGECRRVLKPDGRLLVVMNHPAFRVPKASAWGWDSAERVQYRRVDRYLSQSRAEIQMHPGADPRLTTVSFHRPLEFYFKALAKSGFVVARLEEWISNRKSQPGPRAIAEDCARKEIPLFLCFEALPVPSKPTL